MARKNKRPGRGLGKKETQFLHLKEFSQGKPNELSLNVLEQKAAAQEEPPRSGLFRLPSFGREAEGAEGKEERRKRTGGAKAPSHKKVETRKKTERRSVRAERKNAPAVQAGSERKPFLGADSQEEIARRKQRRKWYRRLSIATVVVVCLCAVGVGGYWAYQKYERLSTSVGVLHEACGLIEQSDKTTVAIDEYFQDPFDDDTISRAQQLSAAIPDAKEQLESARVYAQKAESELDGSQRDKEAAQRTLNAVASRENLLDVADKRMKEDIVAKQGIDAMNEAWSHIQEGNALLAQAATVVSDTTAENVGKSTEFTTSAQAQFSKAKDSIAEAKKIYPAANYDDELAYIEKRMTAINEALASNAAILIQDKSTAEAHNDAYNKADQEAVALAKELPKQFSQPVADVYSATTADLVSQYESLRADAASNDAYLREYLGQNQQ